MSVRTELSDPLGSVLAVSCDDRADFDSLRPLPAFRHHRAILDQLLADHADSDLISIDGYCFPCDRPSTFQLNRRPLFRAETDVPNWREGLHCTNCGMNNRVRSMTWMTEQVLGGRGHAAIYTTEQHGAFYPWLRTRYGGGVIGSEYLDPSTESGCVVEGIRHEDVERLSFGDARFDLVISMDVLEHVNDPVRAIEEIARVIKPGGQFLLSVPFFAGSQDNVRRAQMLDGDIVFHADPEYHGSRPPAHGWLVYWDFGWELVEDLRAVFESVEVVVHMSFQYAHLGPNLMVFRCGRAR